MSAKEQCPMCQSFDTGIKNKPNGYRCHNCGGHFTLPVEKPEPKKSMLEPLSILDKLITISGDRMKLIPIGDIHVGAPEGQCDFDKLKRELSYILNTEDCYMLGMGDYMDCAAKVPRKGPSVFASSLSPMMQYEKIYNYFKPLAEEGKILGLLKGNHEDWMLEDSGMDSIALLCESLRVPYLGSACDLKLRVRSKLETPVEYIGYAQHGSSSAKLANTKIGSALNATRDIFADFYCYGHVHQVASTKTAKWMLGQEQKAYQILTGHFLNWQGGYAQAFGISPSPTGVAKISLFADRKDIHVSI